MNTQQHNGSPKITLQGLGQKLIPPKDRRDTAWVVKTLFLMFVACSVIAALGAGAVFWTFSRDLPKIITVADYRPRTVTRILAAPDPANPQVEQLIGEFYGEERRYVVPYDKIPELVVRAFIAAEDDKFFEHGGVNVVSLIRAGIANFRAGRKVQGGSTITQQVAKSLLLTREKSYVRKIREMILASRIENALTKQEILYLYLNQIYLGHGAYGVQAAAKAYYRKDVSELTVAEAAVLGGLPQAPGIYSPLSNPKKAKERQLYVLRRMFENRFISQAEYTEAAALPLRLHNDENINLKHAPYLVEHLRRYLADKYGDKALYEEGMTVTVPGTAALMRQAGKSIRAGLAQVDKRIGYRGPLQRLTNPADIEKFLREERLKLIERRVGYQMLMPDGRLDTVEAMKDAGLQSEADLLQPGELYKGVVMTVDDKRKTSSVLIGAARAELPLEKMKWARPMRDEKSPPASKSEITLPSQALKKGDVILVRLAMEAEGPKGVAPAGLTVALEQEPQVQAALVSLDVHTGNVLAMEGGYSFEASEFNRASQALRQAGSAFKPFVYAAALEKGFNPASIIVDAPIVYDEGEFGKWKPSNFEEKFYGDTTFRQALIKSRNIPTIKIAQALTVPAIIEYAKRLGIEGKLPADLSMSLGSGSISLLEMTRSYALFPRLGRKATPIFFSKVFDRDGKLLEEQKPSLMPEKITIAPAETPEPLPSPALAGADAPGRYSQVPMPKYPLANDPDQVLDPRVAFVMTHLMNEVVNYGTGHEAKALGRAAAGKTGTTTDYIDAWFMGFTPNVVTGVWVGFDNQRSIGPLETGARAALPIWLSFMQEAVKNHTESEFTIPPGVVFASIDPATGKLASPNSSTATKEAFVEGTQPTETGGQSGKQDDSQGEFFKEDVE
jgi:penicillin-binding protein 1A